MEGWDAQRPKIGVRETPLLRIPEVWVLGFSEANFEHVGLSGIGSAGSEAQRSFRFKAVRDGVRWTIATSGVGPKCRQCS